MKILLIDENKELANSIKKSLMGIYEIIIADSYFMAKEYIILEKFDLILSETRYMNDHNSGIKLLSLLMASSITTPVIMLASETDISCAVKCLKSGAKDFIEKSKDNDTTVNKIKDAIDKVIEVNHITPGMESRDKIDIKILFVDDNDGFTESIKFHFAKIYNIDILNDFSKAEDIIKQKRYDCIFLDIRDEIHYIDNAGIIILKYIMDFDRSIPVVMLSGWADIDSAVECLKLGAMDFLEKSFDMDNIINNIDLIVKKIIKNKAGKSEVDLMKGYCISKYRVIDIIGESDLIKKIRREIIEVAKHDIPVFIYGETGTGKEMVASAIHIASNRRENNFIEVDCGSIPESLFESELFGYKKGAFTGAAGDRKGKMECAHNGTLFLDEIENLSLDQQAKLLRVLENKKIYPLGSTEGRIVDFKLICATNVNLHKMVEEGGFRNDLFYRLNVYHIELPPLRERGEQDIMLLIEHFIRNTSINTIEKDALEVLKRYTWPGNIRELKNLLFKFEIIARNNNKDVIDIEIIKEGFSRYKDYDRLNQMLNTMIEYYNSNNNLNFPKMISDLEDMIVSKIYKEYKGNLSKTAERVYKKSPDDKKDYRHKVRRVLERNKLLFPDEFL